VKCQDVRRADEPLGSGRWSGISCYQLNVFFTKIVCTSGGSPWWFCVVINWCAFGMNYKETVKNKKFVGIRAVLGFFRSAELWFHTDVSGQPIVAIFEGQAVHAEFFLHCLTLKMGIGCPETSVRNYSSALRKIPEERRYDWNRGESFKLRISWRTSSMLNMFRTLIHPSSGACDFSIVSPHWPCVLVSMCVQHISKQEHT